MWTCFDLIPIMLLLRMLDDTDCYKTALEDGWHLLAGLGQAAPNSPQLSAGTLGTPLERLSLGNCRTGWFT